MGQFISAPTADQLSAEQIATFQQEMKGVIRVMEEKFKFLYVDPKAISLDAYKSDPKEYVPLKYEGAFKEVHLFHPVIKEDKQFVAHSLVPEEGIVGLQKYHLQLLSYIQLLEQSQPYVTKSALPQLKYWTVLEKERTGQKFLQLLFIYDEFDFNSSLQMKAQQQIFNCQIVYSYAIQIFKTLVVTRNLKIMAHFDGNLIFNRSNPEHLIMIPSLPCGENYNQCQDYLTEPIGEGKFPAELKFINEKALAELRSLALLLIKLIYGPAAAKSFLGNIFINSKTKEIFAKQYFEKKNAVQEELANLTSLCREIIEPFLGPPQMIPSPVEYLKHLQSPKMVKLFQRGSVSFSADSDAVGQALIGQDLEQIQQINNESFKKHCLQRESLLEALTSSGQCLFAASSDLSREEFVVILKELISQLPRSYQFQACYTDSELDQALRQIYLSVSGKQ